MVPHKKASSLLISERKATILGLQQFPLTKKSFFRTFHFSFVSTISLGKPELKKSILESICTFGKPGDKVEVIPCDVFQSILYGRSIVQIIFFENAGGCETRSNPHFRYAINCVPLFLGDKTTHNLPELLVPSFEDSFDCSLAFLFLISWSRTLRHLFSRNASATAGFQEMDNLRLSC